MNEYIIVLPQGALSSPERALAISRQLYCITRPLALQTPEEADFNVFSIIRHPDGRAALVVDVNYTIVVNPLSSLERLVALFGELSSQELLDLQAYIFNNATFQFGQIIPSNVIVRDRAYMIADGWFPDEEFTPQE